MFTDDDARIMNAFSIHAAIALENARLYEQEREKIRIERDLLAAREVQMSLLPPHPPDDCRVRVCGDSTARPARWRAISMISSGSIRPTLAVSVGDVSGKGLPAALLMAHIQASVRDVAHEAENAGTCVTMLNQRLCGEHRSRRSSSRWSTGSSIRRTIRSGTATRDTILRIL